MIAATKNGFLSPKVDPIKNRRYKTTTIYGGIGTIPTDGVNSPVSVTLKGQTATNIVANGNFANGTTGWTAAAGSTISAASNVLRITGSGSARYVVASKVTDVISAVGKKVYFRCLARVTNANCTSLEFVVDGAVGGTNQSTTQVSLVQNQWYPKSFIATQPADVSGKIEIKILHNYADAATANGKVMEVKEVIAIDLTTMGLDTLTAAQCDAKFANWFDGTKSTVSGTIQVKDPDGVVKGQCHYNGMLRSVGVESDTVCLTSGVEIRKVDTDGTALANTDIRKKNIYIEYGITNPITAKAGDTIIWTPTGDPTDTTTPEIIVKYGV